MRLIDADALEAKAFGDKHPEFYDGQDIADWYEECVMCAPSVGLNNSWMVCSERLPTKDDDYNVTIELRYKASKNAAVRFSSFAHWSNESGWSTSAGNEQVTAEIVAWQPLPKPYKGEE